MNEHISSTTLLIFYSAILLPDPGTVTTARPTIRSPTTGTGCRDANGNTIGEGQIIPNNDPCLTCTCENGLPVCATPVCDRPAYYQLCEANQVQGQCCLQYDCSKGMYMYIHDPGYTRVW